MRLRECSFYSLRFKSRFKLYAPINGLHVLPGVAEFFNKVLRVPKFVIDITIQGL